MIRYYKTDNKILTFNVNSDVDLIRFNHYIMQKENLQRLREGELNKGSFFLSVRTVASDLNISNSKAQKIIKQFVNLGIIKVEYISKTNTKASIYAYRAASETHLNTHNETDEKNGITRREDRVGRYIKETDFGTSKKEDLKSSCSCIKEKDEILEDEKVLIVKQYGFNITNEQAKLIATLEKTRLTEALNITVAQGGKSFSYMYKVYLNNPKTEGSNRNNIKKNNNKLNKNMRNKPIYMCSTKVEINGKYTDTNDLTEEEFEKLIMEKQQAKW